MEGKELKAAGAEPLPRPPQSLHPWLGDRNLQVLHSQLLQPPAVSLSLSLLKITKLRA